MGTDITYVVLRLIRWSRDVAELNRRLSLQVVSVYWGGTELRHVESEYQREPGGWGSVVSPAQALGRAGFDPSIAFESVP